jgi:hypothetical protein
MEVMGVVDMVEAAMGQVVIMEVVVLPIIILLLTVLKLTILVGVWNMAAVAKISQMLGTRSAM